MYSYIHIYIHTYIYMSYIQEISALNQSLDEERTAVKGLTPEMEGLCVRERVSVGVWMRKE